ncbi:MAG: glycosyltransferase family 4 protein [Bacteroidetes bacterium]|nr:glycosyltransferase family 4 protein [Bacteroidota bacterium]
MRILELNFERSWRGGERQTVYNIQGFLKAGFSVTLVCRAYFPLEKYAQENGWHFKSFTNVFSILLFLFKEGKNYDVIHAQTAHILTYCIITKWWHRRPVIFSRRVDFVPKGRLTKWKYRQADAIVAVSVAVKKIVESFCGRSDVVVISDIAIPEKRNDNRAYKTTNGLGIDANKKILGAVAALVPHKDPLTLIRAINILSKKRSDFVLLHFGIGELRSEMDKMIAADGLENQYRCMGFVENVVDFFSVFDVFVMSSQEEGLGSSVLDAYLYRVPVVGTNAGGLNDILLPGMSLKVPKQSPEALADAIDQMLDMQEADKQKMIQTAYQFVLSMHGLEVITQKYIALFNSLLKKQ